MATGLPTSVPAVARHLAEMNAEDQRTIHAVDHAAALIVQGMTYSNVLANLGFPTGEWTNGLIVTMIYKFDGPSMPGRVITNGIDVDVSNGVVIGRSFTGGMSEW